MINKKLKVVVINGFPGSGKDTFVKTVKMSIVTEEPVLNLHTSEPVKAALQSLGWNGEKTPEVRDLLANLLKESDRLFDTSFQYINSRISHLKSLENSKAVVFIHCREPHNITRYVKAFNAATLLIIRDVADESPCETTNDSDKNVYNYKYDKIIWNNGSILDLHNKAKTYMEELTWNWSSIGQ